MCSRALWLALLPFCTSAGMHHLQQACDTDSGEISFLQFSNDVRHRSLQSRYRQQELQDPCLAVDVGTHTWPLVNPALVAPAVITFDYALYSAPLVAELTEDAISFAIPPDYAAFFNLSTENNNSSNNHSHNHSHNHKNKTVEQYILRSIELRRHIVYNETDAQGIYHRLEASFLHQETSGSGYWANVVVPFIVGSPDTPDILSVLVSGGQLPTRMEHVEAVMVDSYVALDLNQVWQTPDFQAFWTTLPTKCHAVTANTRQFMRNDPFFTLATTFNKLADALSNARGPSLIEPASTTWLIRACARGDVCEPLPSVDLHPPLQQALEIQGQALISFRAAKAAMDEALTNLEYNANDAYSIALAAAENLRYDEDVLKGMEKIVQTMQAWIEEVNTSTWDEDAPAPNGNTSILVLSASACNATALLELQLGSQACVSKVPAAMSVAQAASVLVHTSKGAAWDMVAEVGHAALHPQSCGASARKPPIIGLWDNASVHISHRNETMHVEIYPGHSSFLVSNEGDHMRLSASRGEQVSLGKVVSGSFGKELSHIDVRIPGEHVAANGKLPAAELQFVHVPEGDGPAFAIALGLDTLGDHAAVSLQPFSTLLPRVGMSHEVSTDALQEMMNGFRGVLNGGYSLSNGTLTSKPCLVAHWTVLRNVASITGQQLVSMMRGMSGL